MKNVILGITFLIGVAAIAVGIFILLDNTGWSLILAGIAFIVAPLLYTIDWKDTRDLRDN